MADIVRLQETHFGGGVAPSHDREGPASVFIALSNFRISSLSIAAIFCLWYLELDRLCLN